jgi:hypothetical protein
MPATGRVEWYDKTRGFGVLVTNTGERVGFDGDVWANGGSAAAAGLAVTIEWRRARAGAWNVPALVRAAGSHEPAPTFTVASWIAAVQTITGRLRDVTPAQLAEASDDLEPWAERTGEDWAYGTGTRDDAWKLFSAAATVDSGWVHHFDHREFDAGFALLPPMVGLSLDDITPQPRRRVEEYFLRECNRKARGPERLFSLHTGGDNYVVVALPPADVERLAAEGYLRLASSATAEPRSWRDRVASWLGRR